MEKTESQIGGGERMRGNRGKKYSDKGKESIRRNPRCAGGMPPMEGGEK